MDESKVKQLADGRVYTGSQALKAGLVDKLGNFYDAVDEAAELGNITGEPRLKEYGAGGPFGLLFDEMAKGIAQELKPDLIRQLSNVLSTSQAQPECR